MRRKIKLADYVRRQHPERQNIERIDEFQKQNALKATAEACANKQAQNAKPVAQVNEQTGDKITIGATLKDLNLDEWTKYDGNNFYYAVKPQIDELFVRYPEEKILNDAVANSKWAHVQTGEDYYVVGVLFNATSRLSYVTECLQAPSKILRPNLKTLAFGFPSETVAAATG